MFLFFIFTNNKFIGSLKVPSLIYRKSQTECFEKKRDRYNEKVSEKSWMMSERNPLKIINVFSVEKKEKII